MKKKRFKFFPFFDLQCRWNVIKKMKVISFFLMFGVIQSFTIPCNAMQEGSVTGKVTDNDGVGLPGVSVVIKGTVSGAVTNFEGIYVISGVTPNSTLIFSFIGMEGQEIAVGDRTQIDVTMISSSSEIDELVVIGYGTIKKSDLTGSVGSITAEELNSVPAISISEGIQGRLAGVAVTTNSGAPGGGISVKIRGNTSILNGSEPLYVIDGFPVTGESQFKTSQGTGMDGGGSEMAESDATVAQNPLAAINPSDIESIEVLKDASACAIYGVRGANGVILITTKRGKAGQQQISFNSYIGFQKVSKKIDMMNASEYMAKYNEAEVNAGNDPIFTSNPTSIDKDWQDEIFTTAMMQNYQLGVSGGNEAVRYNITGSYFGQDGIIKKSGFERYTLRSNIDVQATEKFKVGTSLTVSKTSNDYANVQGEANNGITGAALAHSPLLDVYDEDGITYSGDRLTSDFGIPAAEGERNPVAMLNELSDNSAAQRVLGTLFGEYSFTDDLKFKVSVGADMDGVTRRVFQTEKLNFGDVNNRATVSSIKRQSFLNENTLNYNKSFGKHSLGALAGFTIQSETEEYFKTTASGFPSNATSSYDIGSGSETPELASDYGGFNIMSFIGRLNYNYDSRYLVTGTLRRDGSSKFAKGEKWATFPSIAAAWRINNEAFLSDVSAINNLKVRAGWGVVGNQEIDPYSSLATLQSTRYNFSGTRVGGVAPFRVAVPNLTWETTNQLNFGLDLSLLESRINITADYYIKKTKDLLLAVTLPQTSGITEPSIQNIGEMENKGWELAIDGNIISTADFSWNLGFNISANKNKITSLGDENIYGDLTFLAPQPTFSGGTVLSQVKVGQPIGVFYGYKYDGIYRDQTEADAGQVIQPGVEPGMARYADVEPGGGAINADDRTELGSPFPDFTYGINTNIKYKAFELRMFFQGQKGGKVYNMMRRFNSTPSRGHNMVAELNDSWAPDNTGAEWPKVNRIPNPVEGSGSLGASDFYLEDATYLRMRELTLTYYLPNTLFAGKIGGSVYVQGQNLFTITDYKGYNPDTNGRSGQNVGFGYDASPYPLAKAFIMGFKLNF